MVAVRCQPQRRWIRLCCHRTRFSSARIYRRRRRRKCCQCCSLSAFIFLERFFFQNNPLQVPWPERGTPGAWAHRYRLRRVRDRKSGNRCKGRAQWLQDNADTSNVGELCEEVIKGSRSILYTCNSTVRRHATFLFMDNLTYLLSLQMNSSPLVRKQSSWKARINAFLIETKCAEGGK